MKSAVDPLSENGNMMTTDLSEHCKVDQPQMFMAKVKNRLQVFEFKDRLYRNNIYIVINSINISLSSN